MKPSSPKTAALGPRVIGWRLTPKGVEWATETLAGALVGGRIAEADLPGWIGNAVVEVSDEQAPSWRRQLSVAQRAAREASA